jgi:hypothetical protein
MFSRTPKVSEVCPIMPESGALAGVIAKLQRAEHHLVDLEALLSAWAETSPYSAVAERRNGGPVEWYLRFSAAPDPTAALLVGDLLHNARAAMEYLAAAMVPAKYHRTVSFPIFYEPVWDMPPMDDESSEVTRRRASWDLVTKGMPAEALEFIKALQPVTESEEDHQFHVLGELHRLAIRDRHRGLHILAEGLTDVTLECRTSGGVILPGRGAVPSRPRAAFGNGAIIRDIPESAVEVTIAGTPVAAIQGRDFEHNVKIPDQLRAMLLYIRDFVFTPLARFVQP